MNLTVKHCKKIMQNTWIQVAHESWQEMIKSCINWNMLKDKTLQQWGSCCAGWELAPLHRIKIDERSYPLS